MTTRLERQRGCLRCCLTALLLALVSAGALGAEPGDVTKSPGRQARKHYFRSFLGRKPLELETDAKHWVNTEEKLTLQQLHGSVVWLEFNF